MKKDVKVLILDNRNEYSSLIAKTVNELGYSHIMAQEPQSAVQALGSVNINVLVAHLDLSPDEIAKFISPLKKFRSALPVLLVEESPERIEKSYLSGVDLVLKPPFLEETLKKTIQRFAEPSTGELLRIYERHYVELPVLWKIHNDEQKVSSKTLNIGVGGIFITEENKLPKRKQIIEFELKFLSKGPQVTLKGIVRWVRPPGPENLQPGFGVELLHTPENYNRALAKL